MLEGDRALRGPYQGSSVRCPGCWEGGLMDLDGGAGFDRVFLTEQVEPPTCDPAELLVVDGQVEIRYMHFSLVMHRKP